MNKVILIGNLTRDPELSQTPNGISVCKFSIAVSRNFKNANGEYETDFINIIAWRNLADNCGKFLSKGSKVAVCGAMQTRNYDDKDGVKRYVTEVIAEDVEFLSSQGKQGSEAPPEPYSASKKTTSELKPIEDEGLPF